MKRLVIVALAAITVVTLGGFGSGTSHTSAQRAGIRFHSLKFGVSTNWSGYATLLNQTSQQYNAVSNVAADWTVPFVTCVPGNQYSAIWIGIDGYNNNTVEQIGTGQDCRNGTPNYYVWYEMYPRGMVRTNLLVLPGNTVTANVQYTGNFNFQLKLTNQTTGNSYTTTQRLAARRQSAEWVVEAPSSVFGVLPLSNFGTATITNASTTMNGHTGSISDTTWHNDKITMQSGSTVKASPSNLTSGGTSFTDSWDHL